MTNTETIDALVEAGDKVSPAAMIQLRIAEYGSPCGLITQDEYGKKAANARPSIKAMLEENEALHGTIKSQKQTHDAMIKKLEKQADVIKAMREALEYSTQEMDSILMDHNYGEFDIGSLFAGVLVRGKDRNEKALASADEIEGANK